ncbi:MAG: sugar phosphate isomerase/epimerase [Bryobacterales bacterium]|nr:sugar phosphate isomerase/epimerase [Bryobacterales bacterium]
MKFGANTLIWTAHFDRPHLDLIPRMAAHGFDYVEVARFNWDDFPAAEIRRTAEAAGLGVLTCSAMPGLSLLHDDAGERAKAVAYLRQAIQCCAEAGGKVLVGPLYSPVGQHHGRRRTEEEWKRQVEALQTLAPLLEATGVTLAIEPLNRFETYFLNTMSDAARLCREVNHPRVGILYDTFHANIEEKSQVAAIHDAGRWIAHVHTCENDRGIPGSGHVEWRSVFATLQEVGYDGVCSIESFGFNIPELIAPACIWRDFAATPESIPWEGLPFLKRTLASVVDAQA